jgi:hypothetical protein
MKPFDKMNTVTARLLILIVLAFIILTMIPVSRFLYTGVNEAFEMPIPGNKNGKKESE